LPELIGSSLEKKPGLIEAADESTKDPTYIRFGGS
jgi:hypothetical protein